MTGTTPDWVKAKVEAMADGLEAFKKTQNDRIDDLEARFATQGLTGITKADHANVDQERKEALKAYWRKGENGITGEIRNALSVGSDPEGGYFVEPDTNGRIVEFLRELSPIRRIANVDTTGSVDAMEGINDLGEAGSGWVGEEESRTETDTPDTGKYRIPLHELYAEPKATQKLLDDTGFDVEGWLTRKLGRRFARVEGEAFITGDGVKKPRGFLTYDAGTPTATNWNVIEQINTGAAGDFAASDPADVLYDALFALKDEYQENATWVMKRTTMRDVAKLKDGDGNYLLTMGDIRQGTPLQLLGHPVLLAEGMPAKAADSLSIAVGDFREAYQVVDHTRGTSILRDPYTTKGWVKFYSIRRMGGAVVNFEALKLIKFAS